MDTLHSLYDQAIFLASSLTWLGMIDLLLVAAAFYFLLSLIRRSSAAYLLRELLMLGAALFVLTALLPLPVFDWVVRGLLVMTLIATPIVFQAQLRHFIERVGRTIGIAQSARQSIAEGVNFGGRVTGELLQSIFFPGTPSTMERLSFAPMRLWLPDVSFP